MSYLVHFNYQGITLSESLWKDGRPYFSARAIGEFLEYSDPTTAISKIVKRNPHINDPRWSTPTSLVGVEGGKEVTRTIRVYDAMGLQLIMFESRQPKAIQYKIAVAALVIAVMNGELKPSKWTLNHDLVSAAKQIQSLAHGSERRELIKDLAERDGVCLQTVYRRLEQATGERLKTKKGTVIHRKTAGSTKYPVEKEKILSYSQANPSATGAQIKKTLDLLIHRNQISRWLREAKRLSI